MSPAELYLMMGIFIAVCMACGVVLWKIIDHCIYFYKYYTTRENFPRLHPLDDDKLCKDPHSWEETKLAMMVVPFAQYKVCSKCGFVSGTEYQLNPAGIQQMNETMVIRRETKAREELQISRFKEILDADREMWIKTYGPSFGKDQDKNVDLLRHFSNFTVESMESASQRVIRELQEKK